MPGSQESFLFCSPLYTQLSDRHEAQYVFTTEERMGEDTWEPEGRDGPRNED